MKKIVKKIIQHKRGRLFLGGLSLLIVCMGAWLYLSHAAESQFERMYTKYAVVAGVQQNDAFIPGAEANPLRDTLNRTLGRMLAKETKPAERLVFAEQSLGLIAQLNKQVDAIGDTAPHVSAVIASLESSAHDPRNIFHHDAMQNIVKLAQKQMAIIEDIRGLSYRANFEVTQICNHITSAHGVLTNAYTTELNDNIPVLEAEFNKRENSYADLQSNIQLLQKAYDSLTRATL